MYTDLSLIPELTIHEYQTVTKHANNILNQCTDNDIINDMLLFSTLFTMFPYSINHMYILTNLILPIIYLY